MDEINRQKSEFKQCLTRGVPYLVGDSTAKRIITKARCKQWDCEYCAEINRSEHYNRIASGLQKFWEDGRDMQFTTITCHEKWRGQSESIKNWRTNKDKLLARYRRKYKRDYSAQGSYVYIPELHKDETIHIHGIFLGAFGDRWWKDNARESGLGYMAKAAKLTSVLQGVNYCLKYITKQMGTAQVMSGFRRINYAQGFPRRERHESHFDWTLLDGKKAIESAIIEGISDGKTVEFGGDSFESFDDLLY